MKTSYVKQFNMSKADQNLIRSMVHMSVENFITGDDERKAINILLNDRVIPQHLMDRIVTTLESAKERIFKKIEELNRDYKISELPENAGGRFSIILRPKEFVQILLDNYNRHQRNIDEIILVLLVEAEPDEDETEE